MIAQPLYLAILIAAHPPTFPEPPPPPFVALKVATPKVAATATISFLNTNWILTVQSSTNLVNWKTLALTSSTQLTVLVDTPKTFFNVGVLGGQGTVTVTWDPPVTPVDGYFLWWGPGSRTYTNFVNTGHATRAVLHNMEPNTLYFFAAVSYSVDGLESDLSTEVRFRTPTLWPVPRKISVP